MKYIVLISLLFAGDAYAMNRESALGAERGRGDISNFESEKGLQRDLMGRKLVIDPNSKIDTGSLQVEMAPGSTVIIRGRQYNNGVQTVRTPNYNNVEIPN